MRKLIILIIALFCNIIAGKCQPAFTAGLSLSTTANSDFDDEVKFLPAHNFGVTFDLGSDTRKYAFRPGVVYCVKGWKKIGLVDEKQLYINHMLQFPLYWIHKIRLNDNLRIDLGYGCFVEFAFDGNVKVKYPELTGSYVINGQQQTVHYDKITKNFRGKIFAWNQGNILYAGMSTNRYYAGVALQSSLFPQGMVAFLFNAAYYLNPCRQKVKHSGDYSEFE